MMSDFAYPKPFDFGNELSSVAETTSSTAAATQEPHRAKRSQQSPRTTGVRDDSSSRQDNRSSASGRKLLMKSLPGRSKSSDDALLLAAQAASRNNIRGPPVTAAPRRGGLGPKTKSGRCLPKPVPSIPIRNPATGPTASGSQRRNSSQRVPQYGSKCKPRSRSVPRQTPQSQDEEVEDESPPRRMEDSSEDSVRGARPRPRRGISQVILQDVNGGPTPTSRKETLPKVVTPEKPKPKDEVKKPNSLKNFFNLTPRSKKDVLNRTLHSAPAQSPSKNIARAKDGDDEYDSEDDDDDDDDMCVSVPPPLTQSLTRARTVGDAQPCPRQQDFLSQSDRMPTARDKVTTTRRPHKNPLRRFSKSHDDEVEDESLEEEDDDEVKPASARSRSHRNHQDHVHHKKEKVSRNLKSFQQLLGKKKNKETSSSMKNAPRSPVGNVRGGVATRRSHSDSNSRDLQQRGPSRTNAPIRHDYDDSSEGSLSPEKVQKPASFLTSMLDTLYDSYIGPDDDHRKDGDSDEDEVANRHQGSLSRFDLSISGLF